MAKAEASKRVFDQDVKAGATFDEVLAYLTAHRLHFGSDGLTAPQDEPSPQDRPYLGPISGDLLELRLPVAP